MVSRNKKDFNTDIYVSFFNAVGNFSNKNVNVTTIMFLMSGDLTGLCLYMTNTQDGVHFCSIQVAWLSGIQVAIEYQTILHRTSFWPIEYWTSLLF